MNTEKAILKKRIALFIMVCVSMLPSLTPGSIVPRLKTFSSATYLTSPRTLNTFINQVLENNPAIQAAEANVAATHARQVALALPLYNPELTAEAQQAIEKSYTVGLTQTVDWANKRAARAQMGAANLHVAEAQLRLMRQQLEAEVLNALARYHISLRVIVLAKKRTALLQQFVSLTEKRHAKGDVARVDVDLALLALSEAIAQEAQAKVNLNRALQTLRATTGFMQERKWPHFLASLPPLTLDSVSVELLMRQLPALQVLTDQYFSAQTRLLVANKGRYADPTFGIQGGKLDTPEGKSSLFIVNLNVPLFVRNPFRAEVDAANFDVIEAEKKRFDLIRQVRAEITGSAERYQMLYASTKAWQRISNKPLSDGLTLIERLWQAGEITSTDYLVQLKQRVDSQIAGVELQGQSWQAWVEWLKASGTIEDWLSGK